MMSIMRALHRVRVGKSTDHLLHDLRLAATNGIEPAPLKVNSRLVARRQIDEAYVD
jgi:hypothetical protein